MRLPPALTRALAFDAGGLAPAAAARSAAGVLTPLIVGAAVGHPADGAIAAAGALPVGVAAMSGTLPTAPLGLLVTTTIGMSLSTFVGSLCAGHGVALAGALVLWGFAAGLLVSLGKAATITGVQALVGLVVFGRYPGGIATSALHAAAVLVGGLIQTVYALALHVPTRHRPERVALADLYQRLAALATGGTHGGPSGEAIATTMTLLERRSPDLPALRDLSDEAARIRLELQALTSVRDLPGVEEVTGAAAGELRRIARSIARGEPPAPERPELAAAVAAVRREAADVAGRAGTRMRFAAARTAALLGQVRAADRLAASLAGERHLPLPRIAGIGSALQLRSALQDDFSRLRETAQDRDSPAFRHAVRLAVVLPLAEIVSRLLPWQRGYWVPLTAAVVLKPDYAATVQRGFARVIGTGLGVVVAGLLVAWARPTGAGLVVAVAVAAWASYAVFAASYALYSFALTALVVLLVSTGDPKPLAAVADRGLDTLVGGAIALLGYLAWPTHEAATVVATSARLLSTLSDYAQLVLRGYVEGRYDDRADRPALTSAARAARRARADAQASVDRARAEPARTRPRLDAATSTLNGARRIVITLHALRTTLQDSRDHVPLPEVAEVRDDIVAALRTLSEAISTDTAPELPDLRAAQHRLEELADAEPATLRGRRLALVAAHLDPLVDSIDTVGSVLARRRSTPQAPSSL